MMKNKPVILKDSTMREGLDVPGVRLNVRQKGELLQKLARAGIPEAELVAPGRFEEDLQSLKEMGRNELPIKLSGLIYGCAEGWREQIDAARGILDRVDILLPLTDLRPPAGRNNKKELLKEIVSHAAAHFENAGIGFPHATQVDRQFVLTMCLEAVSAGAKRITIYDTNGGSDPWKVGELINSIRGATEIEICFHAHNDLGLATANSLAAVRAGADCLDVTVNGLGDRAGNASLEQVAMALHMQGFTHNLQLKLLKGLSRAVASMTMIPLPGLAPVVGEFVFHHKSPGHLQHPELFEPFDPGLIGTVRKICKS